MSYNMDYNKTTIRGHKTAIVTIKTSWQGKNKWKCGYVQIPESHPWLQAETESQLSHVNVHGCLTYLDIYENLGEGMWVGFDTNHASDTNKYWSDEEMTTEINKIIDQMESTPADWKPEPPYWATYEEEAPF